MERETVEINCVYKNTNNFKIKVFIYDHEEIIVLEQKLTELL